MTDPKTLVTGADGFIGSHLVEALVRSGTPVRAFSLYNSFYTAGWLDSLPEDILKEIEIFRGDIRDSGSVRAAMKGCQSVAHLAALIGIPYSYEAPHSYIETNITGTLNLLQAAREFEVRKFIQTSTSEVYGTAKYVPINEHHPLLGQSPYSASKIGSDQLAYSFYSSFNLPVTILRPFNTFGPRQSMRAVIPSVIVQIASGVKQLKIGSVTPTRDFSYVEDTVNGFVKALESDSSGETINLGSNFEISISATIEKIVKLMDANVESIEDKTRLRPEKSEVERLWADNTKARNLLDWQPKYAGESGFEVALVKTIEWFKNPSNINLYSSDQYVV
jgi:dTDP-glucose 4,6-dehydratase